MYTCTNCVLQGCSRGKMDESLPHCPSKEKEIQEKAKKLFLEEENIKIAYNAALIEAEGYGQMTRVEEIIAFAKKCEYKKIGLVFCIGLFKEAKTFQNLLTYHDFEVISVLCKNGGIEKNYLGLDEEEKIPGECDEIMCNPIGQALLLNQQKTDFNVILGLCVGHDTLVMKYLEAPMTTLAVKDRVTGHNPLATIYLSQGYYQKKLYQKEG
ncbi:DUF1847 domain-containing protein [Irregularibacter muris]|uniref:DUF1847 domain-containing protein n=1 Tax=Irregularibacter muris TaxID=1796619 RepID=A0AAE3L363_9FIRM|nr:DUF1847 domain-containing protein [Irregularibacter muris]MCR1899939.1 DUF1847 domain-containing protein [Irregularibacter muris]